MTQEKIDAIKQGTLALLNEYRPDISEKEITWGKEFQVVDQVTASTVATIVKYCKDQKKLIKVETINVLSVLIEEERILKEKLAKVKTIIKAYEDKINTDLVEKYQAIEDNVSGQLMSYSIKVRKEAEAEAARQRLIAEQRAKEVAKTLITSKDSPLEALDKQGKIDNALAKTINMVEQDNKVQSTIQTHLGGLQVRMAYKVDEPNIDKIEILKWVLKNPEHLGLIDVNLVYARANFNRTVARPKPIEVPGLPIIEAPSLRG